MSVSVVIPAYHSRYLGQALTSVLAQTLPPSEIILVDGSPDSTLPRLSEYRERIKYYYQPPRGVAAARNFGIEKAEGKYVAFLDADDIWLPGKLAMQIAVLERNPEAGFSFSTIWNLVDSEQSRIPSEPFFPVALRKWMTENFKHEGVVSGRVYELLLEVNCIATSSLVIRRDVVEPIGLFDESLSNGEDYEFELRLARKYPAVFVVEPTSRYRVHESGLSGNWSARSDLFYGANLRVLENHYRAYPSSSVKKAMAQNCAGYALYFLSAGDRQSAASYALRSFQLSASPRALKCYVQAVMPKSYRVLSALAGTHRHSDSKSQ